MKDDFLPGLGHNSTAYDIGAVTAFQKRTDELTQAGSVWLNIEAIETEEQAQKGNDFIDQLRKHWSAMEDRRKLDKKPWDEKSTEVHERYKEMLDPIDLLSKKLKPKMAAFLVEKKRRADEEKRAAQAEAQRKREAAEAAAAAAAARHDVQGEVEAEKILKAAQKEEKAALRPASVAVASATGGGRTMSLRTFHHAKIEDDRAARRAFGFLLEDPDSRPALIAEMERLATAARRRKDGTADIPGVTWMETQGAA